MESSVSNTKESKKRERDPTNSAAVLEDEFASYPYEVLDDDHCETPLEAYQDIQSVLLTFVEMLGISMNTFKIYDPYFCEGNTVKRLNSLGFNNVYNKKEDFYKVQSSGSIPDYDILITNPPYSSDHVEKLFNFCIGSKKPWMLLLPNYFYMRDYFAAVKKSCQPFFIIPSKGHRYLYTTPKVSIY